MPPVPQPAGRRDRPRAVGRAGRARAIGPAAGPLAASAGRPLRGYAIHEIIGEGAYGRVYAATQPGTERRVAIKVIRPELADASEFVRRFEAEAQLVARLEHPHIVPLYDYWREPGGAYLVFRLLTGGTARESVLAGGPWSLARVSRLVEEIGGALIAAHAAGVVHNDVKAANVLLDDAGGAYLTDFGIAVDAATTPASGATCAASAGCCGSCSPVAVAAGSFSRVADRAAREGAVPRSPGCDRGARGVDAVLARATAAEGGYARWPSWCLAWRAAVGRQEGALSPLGSSERRAAVELAGAAALRLAERPRRRRTRTRACARSTKRTRRVLRPRGRGRRAADISVGERWSPSSARPARARARWWRPGSCLACAPPAAPS